jgi:hypothetical protein
MDSNRKHKFSAKHGADEQPDPEIAAVLGERVRSGELACAVAFAVAEELGKTPQQVGKAADLLGFRLVKCQLGLFGYAPEKKIVKPKRPGNPELAAAIREAAAKGRLSCRETWQIAARFGIRKMAVSSACEALGQKIKPCQLGAF